MVHCRYKKLSITQIFHLRYISCHCCTVFVSHSSNSKNRTVNQQSHKFVFLNLCYSTHNFARMSVFIYPTSSLSSSRTYKKLNSSDTANSFLSPRVRTLQRTSHVVNHMYPHIALYLYASKCCIAHNFFVTYFPMTYHHNSACTCCLQLRSILQNKHIEKQKWIYWLCHSSLNILQWWTLIICCKFQNGIAWTLVNALASI